MAKYILKRILQAIISVVIVVGIVMLLVYSLMNRDQIFAADPQFQKVAANRKTIYKYEMWEQYGYLDYVNYTDWLTELVQNGELDEGTRSSLANLGLTADQDKTVVANYVQRFTRLYEKEGYQVIRLDAIMAGAKRATGGDQYLFAVKERPLILRWLGYFGNLFQLDTVNSAENFQGERGVSFTLFDPAYGGKTFSPAIIGSGTKHKYLLYCDGTFPFVHQNLISINLGASYSVEKGVDVLQSMTKSQGSAVPRLTTFPTGYTEESADDLHSATYVAGSRDKDKIKSDRFTDDYTSVTLFRGGLSRMGFSFTIGIISVILAYLIAVPVSILTAQKKDQWVDKIGSIYVVFITAIPSLAYIFLVKAIGGNLGLPNSVDIDKFKWTMLVLPIISLALRPIGSTMRWLRRYMVDQQYADYVKFARAGGLSEWEIFKSHVLKNASIPVIHAIPSAVLFSLTGALVTERVYVVPGVGGIFVDAIGKYDNAVIVGVALFYAVLSVTAVLLGDLLMQMVDPRISFTSKAR